MNTKFDVIIIGDSKEGNAAVKRLAKISKKIKIAFISKTFKRNTARAFLNVEYIKAEVVFTDYKNRLFGCHLDTQQRVFGTHLIIATGVKYAPFTIGNKEILGVFNTIADIDKTAKLLPAVVLAKTETDVKFALTVAKKYKQVYLCIDTFNMLTSKSTKVKLDNTANIVVLPNTKILKTVVVDGALAKVDLDNYSTVNCSAIFVKTPAMPETSFIHNMLISRDQEGYLLTTKALESTIVPRCFATGSCTVKNTKKMTANMIDTVLRYLKEEIDI